ncbi:MAG: ABC transporter permease [Chloroflexota bacterium]
MSTLRSRRRHRANNQGHTQRPSNASQIPVESRYVLNTRSDKRYAVQPSTEQYYTLQADSAGTMLVEHVAAPSSQSARAKPLSRPTSAGGGNVVVRSIRRFIGILTMSIRRLQHYGGLSFLALFGVILAVGLVTSAAFFAQAVDTVILRREMAEYTRLTGRPPFSAKVFTASSRTVPLTLDRVEELGENVADTMSSEVGLPVRWVGLQVDSGVVKLQPRQGTPNYNPDMKEQDVNVRYLRDIAPEMEIIEGTRLDEGASDELLDAWAHIQLAEKMGLQVNDAFNLTVRGSEAFIGLRVAGIWQPVDADDAYWPSDPDLDLADKLVIRRDDYERYMQPLLEVKVRTANWQVVLDEQAVIPANARDYLDGFERGEVVINKYLPDARVTIPSVSLGKFVERQTALTTLILGFNIPSLSFLLYFLILISTVIAYWQQKELVVMISRGMSRLDVIYFTVVDSIILFLIGLPLGLGFGILLAQLMGYTFSFLTFGYREPLPVSIYGINIPLVVATLGITMLAKLWSVVMLNRRQILERSREHARPVQGPFWYRNYLDLLLIIPAWYAYQQLLNRGSLSTLVQERPEELYQDPLLVLVPALFVLAMALLAMRVFALIMSFMDRLAMLSPSLVVHLALRQLGRYHHTYINPLLLVIVALALGVYTMSMAGSLDQWLVDRMYYNAGADVAFKPYIESEAYEDVTSRAVGADWIPFPDHFETINGVTAAARVGDYDADIRVATDGGRTLKARFLAIDRTDFDKVAWFRSDFAPEPLGGLMNRLALTPESILVSQAFLDQNFLQVGDQIQMTVYPDFGVKFESQFIITGVYDYFPTVYEDTFTVIGNLEYVFFFFGMVMPHNIWLETDETYVDAEPILDMIPDEAGISTIEEFDAKGLIRAELEQMERVGVFGTLSVSFIVAAIMAALGLLTYSYASLEERRSQFAVLRASGLGHYQVLGQITFEYGILTLFGAIAGVIIGTITAILCVPLFRITVGEAVPLPPLIPVVAQAEIVPMAGLFIAVMVAAQLIIVGVALRSRLFDRLRMGQA